MIDENTIADANLHYINLEGPEPVFMERPLMTDVASWNKTTIIGDGVDEATFGPGIPLGTTARVYANDDASQLGIPPNMTVTIDDGTFEFSATEPGSYFLVLDNPFPYQSLKQEIIVT